MVEIYVKFMNAKGDCINDYSYRGVGGYMNKIIIDDNFEAFEKGFKIIEKEFLEEIHYEPYEYYSIPKDFIDYYCERFMIDKIEDVGYHYCESCTCIYDNTFHFVFSIDEKSKVFENILKDYLMDNVSENFEIRYTETEKYLRCFIDISNFNPPCIFDKEFLEKYFREKPDKIYLKDIKLNDMSYVIKLYLSNIDTYIERVPYE